MAKNIRDKNTGSIYKTENGYRIQVIVGQKPDGTYKYFRPRFKTHAEAVEALKKAQSEVISGRLIASPQLSLESYLDSWLLTAVEPNLAPRTTTLYRWIVKDHIKPKLGKKKLGQITRKDIQKLIADKSKEKVRPRLVEKKETAEGKKEKPKQISTMPDKCLSVSTLRNIRAVLHSAFTDAIRDGLIAVNPASFVDLPKQPQKPPMFLDPKEAAKLSRQIQGTDLEPVIRFFLVTGCRLGEVTGIRWQDIDFDREFVHIRGQLQRIDKVLQYRETTKTNRDRTIPLPPSMVEMLKGMKLTSRYEDPDGIVFLNPYGRRFDPKYLNDALKRICQVAEIPQISVHKLRHTVATLALAETGDLHAVQKVLGHAQVSLTSNLYGHATAETLRPLSNAIEKILNQEDKPNSGC